MAFLELLSLDSNTLIIALVAVVATIIFLNSSSTPTTVKQTPHAAATVRILKPEELKAYTKEEVEKHNKREDCWIIVDGGVYDVTNYVDEHPGTSINLHLRRRVLYSPISFLTTTRRRPYSAQCRTRCIQRVPWSTTRNQCMGCHLPV